MNDPYQWEWLPEKKESLSWIFSKNISELSVGPLGDLVTGVGVTFEVLPTTMQSTHSPGSVTHLRGEVSFSATVDDSRGRITDFLRSWTNGRRRRTKNQHKVS